MGAKTGKASDKVTFVLRFEGSESSSNAHISGSGNSQSQGPGVGNEFSMLGDRNAYTSQGRLSVALRVWPAEKT